MADSIHLILTNDGDYRDRRHAMICTYDPYHRSVDPGLSDSLLVVYLSGNLRQEGTPVTTGWINTNLFDADWRANHPAEAEEKNAKAILYA